jgi:hypothetical protein
VLLTEIPPPVAMDGAVSGAGLFRWGCVCGHGGDLSPPRPEGRDGVILLQERAGFVNNRVVVLGEQVIKIAGPVFV